MDEINNRHEIERSKIGRSTPMRKDKNQFNMALQESWLFLPRLTLLQCLLVY